MRGSKKSVSIDDITITADMNVRMCQKCCEMNYINWWWHDDKNNRWVCYGCGMDRSKEYQKDQEGMKKFYD